MAKHYTREERARILADFSRFDGSVSAFLRTAKISRTTLYNWLGRDPEPDLEPAQHEVTLRPVELEPVTSAHSTAELELHFPSGLKLLLPSEVSPEYIARLAKEWDHLACS